VRSALVEAAEQLTRALDQIVTLPATPALRREQIRLQVALITPLVHVKGYASPETKAAAERARQLIEKAEALGEEPEDPLLLFSVIHGVTVAHFVAFNGDALRELAGQFLALAEKHGAKAPLMIAHRQMGHFLFGIGNFVQSRAHYEKSLALYDPGERQLGMRFGGVDARVSALCFRSLTLWSLGYPTAALTDCDQALREAREIGQAVTLMNTLVLTGKTLVLSRNDATANAQLDELAVLAEEKGAVFWKAWGLALQGSYPSGPAKPPKQFKLSLRL
jgi:tetratricopeptide (TPR) repeat protein